MNVKMVISLFIMTHDEVCLVQMYVFEPFFENDDLTLGLCSKALFLCTQFLSKEENAYLFLSSLSCFDKCHSETSQIFMKTEHKGAICYNLGLPGQTCFAINLN